MHVVFLNTNPQFNASLGCNVGWCPYCQKTMLLIEEKQIPINIELVPMRSYGELVFISKQ